MPQPAEIDGFVFALDHFDHFGCRPCLDERVVADVAETASEGDEPVGGERLLAEEQHEMGVERVAQFLQGRGREVARNVDTVDDGADGRRQRLDGDVLIVHGRYSVDHGKRRGTAR